jgi:trigger factor
MQSVLEDLGGLRRKIKVTVPREEIESEYNARIRKLATDVNIKGFRKGKVPPSVVKLHYGDALFLEIIEETVEKTLAKVLEEQGVHPASPPEVEIKNAKENEPLEYEVSFEVFPNVKLNIEGITVEKRTTLVNDTHVRYIVEQLRKQHLEWQDVDRAAQEGDSVNIDFEGLIDHLPFEGGSAKDFQFELGSKKMLPDFEQAIIGAKEGDTLEVDLVFPENYPNYAGKVAKFTIKVNKVMVSLLPEVNDEFAQNLGVEDGTVSALFAEVSENLNATLQDRIQNELKSQLIEKILEKNVIELPEVSIAQEMNRLTKVLQKQRELEGDIKETSSSFLSSQKQQIEEQARKNVTLGLLFHQWIKDHGIKVDENKIKERIDRLAASYHHPHKIINWYYGNKDALEGIKFMLLEDEVVNKILEIVEVVEKEVPFEELMNIPKAVESD